MPIVAPATEPIRCARRDLRPLTVTVVAPRSEDLRLLNGLRAGYHDLGHRNTVGELRNARIRKATGWAEGTKVMSTIQYLVRINRDPGSDWGASVPDLPGCVATGKTIDSALRRIERGIELHVRGLREDGLTN